MRRSLFTLLSMMMVCTAFAGGQQIGILRTIDIGSAADRYPQERLFAQVSPGNLPGSSAASAGQTKYQVLVASNLDDKQATTLQSSLVNDGFTPVEKVDAGNGQFNVMIGHYDTQKQAEELIEALRKASYLPERVQNTAERSTNQRTVSTAEKGRSYRVQVFEFSAKAKADEAKAQLEKDDYFPVEVVPQNGKFLVLLSSFATQEEASKLLEMIKQDGYPEPRVIAMDSQQASSVKPRISDQPLPRQADSLPQDSKQKVKDIVELEAKAESQTATAEEIRRLQQMRRALTTEERQTVERMKNERVNLQFVEAQVKEAHHKFNLAIQQDRLQDAEKIVADVKNIAPTHALTTSMQTTLSKIKDLLGSKKADPQKIRVLENEAETAMINRDFKVAQEKYEEILRSDPNHANAKAQLPKVLAQRQAQGDQGPGGVAATGGTLANNKYLVWGGAGALALVLLVFSVVLYQNSRREKELMRHVQELTSHTASASDHGSQSSYQEPKQNIQPHSTPAPSVAGGRLGAAPIAGLDDNLFPQSASVGQPELKDTDRIPATPAAPAVVATSLLDSQDKKPVSESDMVMISDLFDMNKMPKPTPDASSESSSLQEEETLRIPELNLQALETAGNSGEEESKPPGMDLPGFDIDELLKKPFPGSLPESEEDASEQPMARIEDIAIPSVAEVRRPPAEPSVAAASNGPAAETVPAPEVETPIPAVAQPLPDDLAPTQPISPVPAEPLPAVAAAAASLFTQDFERENTGEQPTGWSGEYDYATLVVDDRSPAKESTKCLRFEKRSGAGSANYVCHFPKATGHLIVEFDIRCDDKNKYLLGFYVEKDEDFKQSVHTIVHRVDSKSQPSLRIQGEPIPYDFGTWRRVKYDVNLMLGVVNAFVDGTPVVKDAKLATVPTYLNTLSIRDNLATTGLLYLDNIRITRA